MEAERHNHGGKTKTEKTLAAPGGDYRGVAAGPVSGAGMTDWRRLVYATALN